VELFKKPYVGIAEQSSLLEGLQLHYTKLMPVVEVCQEKKACKRGHKVKGKGGKVRGEKQGSRVEGRGSADRIWIK